ncbi:winged helix-turn-helix domain-containing protein [Streptomyces sp. NPDC093568]|uniref:winged helix-turn-helix domain-containing protein n=1 Tax=Streptomyces sp. NPDC093568 TaxID=3366041 RepID=UPI0037F51536
MCGWRSVGGLPVGLRGSPADAYPERLTATSPCRSRQASRWAWAADSACRSAWGGDRQTAQGVQQRRALRRLQQYGPATSADLAAEFNEDRGATSYHLRQLARFGFIEEDTARSSWCRKYWRAIPQGVRLPHHPHR